MVRAKLEHESEPSLEPYTDDRYHEVHIKLAIPVAAFDAAREWLDQHGAVHGFVASRNPNERTPEEVLQFVNLRIGSGGRAAADARVDGLVEVLRRNGFAVREVKRETTIFDTHRAHDRWWA